jgi:hypothetical protein
MSYMISSACSRLKCPGVAKSVLMQLADIANDDGYAWPSLETLCMRTDWGRTAVIDALAWLEEQGAIRRDRSNGRKTVYWLTPSRYTGERHPAPDAPNQSAIRTRPPGVPVRQTDSTSPPNGLNQSAKRTLITNNHQEPEDTPLPPVGGREPGQAEQTGQPDADGFTASFWSLYPRRVDEQLSRKAWAQLAPSADLQREIAAAVRAWAVSAEWQREGGRFVPKPHNWLRRKRWTDVPGLADAPPVVDEAARTRAALDARAAEPPADPAKARQLAEECRNRLGLRQRRAGQVVEGAAA